MKHYTQQNCDKESNPPH